MSESTDASGKNGTARVAVVAAGVISPLGFGLGETLDSLRAARDCVTALTRFSVAQCRCKTAGQVPDERLLAERRKWARPQRFHRVPHMTRRTLFHYTTQVRYFLKE